MLIAYLLYAAKDPDSESTQIAFVNGCFFGPLLLYFVYREHMATKGVEVRLMPAACLRTCREWFLDLKDETLVASNRSHHWQPAEAFTEFDKPVHYVPPLTRQVRLRLQPSTASHPTLACAAPPPPLSRPLLTPTVTLAPTLTPPCQLLISMGDDPSMVIKRKSSSRLSLRGLATPDAGSQRGLATPDEPPDASSPAEVDEMGLGSRPDSATSKLPVTRSSRTRSRSKARTDRRVTPLGAAAGALGKGVPRRQKGLPSDTSPTPPSSPSPVARQVSFGPSSLTQ